MSRLAEPADAGCFLLAPGRTRLADRELFASAQGRPGQQGRLLMPLALLFMAQEMRALFAAAQTRLPG